MLTPTTLNFLHNQTAIELYLTMKVGLVLALVLATTAPTTVLLRSCLSSLA